MQIFLYSRSVLKDYRWVYTGNLPEEIRNSYLEKYRDFEENRIFFIQTPHLYVRFDSQSITMYKFINTNQKDSCSRTIYALVGFVFSGMEYVFANRLLEYVVSYFFCNHDIFLTALEQVSDAVTGQTLSIEFDVNAIMGECENNNDIKKGARFVRDFSKNNPQTSFFMTEEQIKPITAKEGAKLQKGSPTPKTSISSVSKETKDMNDPSRIRAAEDNAQNQGAVYDYNTQGELTVNGKSISPQTSFRDGFVNLIGGLFKNNRPKDE